MAVYSYKAVEADDSPITGDVAAGSPRQARDLLRAKGLTVHQIQARPEKVTINFWSHRRARRHSPAITGFVRDLSTLLAAGIPLLESLDTLIRQNKGSVRAVLLDLREQIASGNSLAEAMRRQGAFFDDLCVNIAGVGENTGTLDVALARLADFKEHAQRLKSRVGTALIYPGIVALVGMAVMIFLMTFVVPNLLATLQQSGRPLPAVTRIVKGISDFLRGYGWLAGLGVIALGFGLRRLIGTARGKMLWHRIILRLPLVGELVRKETIARLAVVLAALLRSGVVFLQAVQIARKTTGNVIFQKALLACEEAVESGQDIAMPLEKTGVFPPMVVQMLAVGQQAGELENMLEQLAKAYERHVDTATARLTAVLEPALILILAIMVGFIVFATILPILEASNVL